MKFKKTTSLVVVVMAQCFSISVVSADMFDHKLGTRLGYEREGYRLAKQGKYEKALEKYRQANNPELFNYDHDKSSSLGAIVRLYKRMGNFEEALKNYLLFKGPNDAEDWPGIDEERELRALIESKKIGSNNPIYDHIEYLKNKHKKYLPPPGGDSGFHLGPMSSIIHLYDYMGDAQGGIDFAQFILSSKKLSRFERAELEKVKAAFEEDKRTGQKGHLQKVIETSQYISW